MKTYFSFLHIVLIIVLLVSCGQTKEQQKEQSREALISTVLGLGYLEENDLDAAESEFRRLIELAPDESTGYANLGLVYLRKGDHDEAERNLKMAIDIDSQNPDIRLILAKTYEMNAERGASIKELLRILEIDPDHVRALYALTRQYAGDDEQKRVDYLVKLSGLLPANIVPKLQLSDYYIRISRPDEALKILELLPQQFPEFPLESVQYYESVVDILNNGNVEDAIRPFMIFHNYMKTSTTYQSGIVELEGSGENLTGFPVISFDPMLTMDEKEEKSSILEIMSFTDITSTLGLDIEGEYSGMSVADFDNDGDFDIYLGSSSASKISRLYMNNFGNYEDVTTASGLIHQVEESASVFSDFNNDGFLDLFVIGGDRNILYKNNGAGSFVDISESAGLAESDWGSQAVLFDMDHEGDLDIIIVGNGFNSIYRNNGDETFMNHTSKAGITEKSGIGGADICFGDFDGDGTTDFAVANKAGKNLIYNNLRQGRYENLTAKEKVNIGENAISIKAGDYNNDGFLDLLIANDQGKVELYKNNRDGSFDRDEKAESSLAQNNIKKALFLDFDNDGFLDILTVEQSPDSNAGVVKLFQNSSLSTFKEASRLLPRGLKAQEIIPADLDDDGDLDLFVLNDNGVRIMRNEGGNVNHYLKLRLVGLRTGNGKNNHFGIGAKVEVRAGELYQMKVITEPVTYFGLGSRQMAEIVRIQWTNGVPQNIFFPKGDASLLEEQLLKGSCPFLYTWDGEQFVFAKDILWRSALGMPLGIMGEAATYAFPNAAQEYIKIPGELLKPKGGKYSIQITSELWETIYFDKLKLIAVDHPSAYEIYVDEKFSPPPYPEHKIYKVADEKVPVSVTNQNGHDLTHLISKKDDQYISNFKLREYQGVTENTTLEIYLGESVNKENLHLFMNGWIFPSDASINTSISQSEKIVMVPPTLQVLNPKGEWQTVSNGIGFPMGKDKTIIIDLSSIFLTDNYRVRLQTNMQIYWDHIFFDNVSSELPVHTTILTATGADLHYRGYSAMERKGGRYGPHWFDYSTVSTGQKWLDLSGKYTRYGDVQSLLAKADDSYVISNSGDELTVTFDAANAPDLPDGWKRDFLIYSEGWVKDGDLNTAAGNTVGPLPFHGMSQYPYDTSVENYPTDTLHQNYQREYNTRTVDALEYSKEIIDF